MSLRCIDRLVCVLGTVQGEEGGGDVTLALPHWQVISLPGSNDRQPGCKRRLRR